MIDDTQEYILVQLYDANVIMQLNSIKKREALYEALELLGWRVVKRDKE